MLKSSELTFLLAVLSVGIINSSADTRILHRSGFSTPSTSHDVVISLDNDQHLLVDGYFLQDFEIPNDGQHRLQLMAIYVSDKNGHRVKYTLEKVKYYKVAFLSASTLKSAAG